MLEWMGRDRQADYGHGQPNTQEITYDELVKALAVLRRMDEYKTSNLGAGSGKTNPALKLSTMMVDLSIQHNRHDPLITDTPTSLPGEPESCPPQPKVAPVTENPAITNHEQLTKAVQLDRNTEVHSRLLQVWGTLSQRFLSRVQIFLSRVRDHVRLRKSRLFAVAGIVAFALLAFGTVHEWRAFHSNFVKSRTQILPTQQADKPPATAASPPSQNTGSSAHAVAPTKSKPRRRQTDYVAKDTYVYYGKDGTPTR